MDFRNKMGSLQSSNSSQALARCLSRGLEHIKHCDGMTKPIDGEGIDYESRGSRPLYNSSQPTLSRVDVMSTQVQPVSLCTRLSAVPSSARL
jgi:hypothetical protein